MEIVICFFCAFAVMVFGIGAFLICNDYQRAKKKDKKEVEKNGKKESINGGNHHDNISNSLDFLRNNKI